MKKFFGYLIFTVSCITILACLIAIIGAFNGNNYFQKSVNAVFTPVEQNAQAISDSAAKVESGISNTQNNLTSLQAEINQLTATGLPITARLTDEINTKLTPAIDNAKSSVDNAQQKISDAKSSVSAVRLLTSGENDLSQSRIDQIENKMADIKQNLSVMQNNITDFQGAAPEKRQQIASTINSSISSINNNLEQYKNSLSNFQNQLNSIVDLQNSIISALNWSTALIVVLLIGLGLAQIGPMLFALTLVRIRE